MTKYMIVYLDKNGHVTYQDIEAKNKERALEKACKSAKKNEQSVRGVYEK